MNRTQNVVNLRLEVYFLSNCTPLNLYVCSPRSNRWHCCLKSLHHYVPSIKPLVSANKPSLTTMSLKVQTLKIVPEALLSLFTLSCKENKKTACSQSKVAVKCSFTFQSFLCSISAPWSPLSFNFSRGDTHCSRLLAQNPDHGRLHFTASFLFHHGSQNKSRG